MPIQLERRDDLYVLEMVDGENRMNRRWLTAMSAALDEVEADTEAAALVTTGAGRFYSNGLDLDWLLADDSEPTPQFVADVEHLLARMLALPIATVAACNGHCFAAGAMFALCHDFRVMRADRGFFCLPEVDIKIPFTPGMDALIKSRLSVQTAHEMMVTGRRYGGVEAATKQIVDEAVADDQVLARSIEIAEEVGGKDRLVLKTIKQRMYEDVIYLLSNSQGTAPT